MREKNIESNNWNSNGAEETTTIAKNNRFNYEENTENEPSRNKYKEFSISRKDLIEGLLDNNSRSSKNRKPSLRAIESFNTVNRNSNNNILQLTQGNSSLNDTPNTEINRVQSVDLGNTKININSTSNRQYKYRYSNVPSKKVEDISNKSNINKNNIKENNLYKEQKENNNSLNFNNNMNIGEGKHNQKEIINNSPNINNNNEMNAKYNLNSEINNNIKNSEHYELSNIETQGNKNKENINNKESKMVSGSSSKDDFKNEENKNGIEINKYSDYSFKNSVSNSNNNFNQKGNKVNNNSSSNMLNNSNENKQSDSNFNKNKSKNKGSKKSSNASSHKKLNISNEEYENKIIFRNSKNNNYISFKDNNQDEEVININNYSLFSDEELQKIYQTLSDINEINIDNNVTHNYMTYPSERKNDNLNVVIKEIPVKVKKRISNYYMKIEKEKEIRRKAKQEQILSLKQLEKKINQIKREIKIIDINDYYNKRIEQLHFNDFEDDKDINDKLYKMADKLNKDFYNDIDEKLKLAKVKINELVI